MEDRCTGLMAASREDQGSNDVDSARVPASSRGDITMDGKMCHVRIDDGGWRARFDVAIHGESDIPGVRWSET